jgi:hypothetical protein
VFLLAQAGQSVQFRNSEDVLHNVRVTDAATTAEDGSFNISNVRPGQYNLTVYAGPAPVVRPIEVKTGRTDLGVIQ